MREKPFAVRLRLARERAGLNQRQAAKAAGISQSYWAKMELGEKDPAATIRKIETATRKLSDALGVELEVLVPRRKV